LTPADCDVSEIQNTGSGMKRTFIAVKIEATDGLKEAIAVMRNGLRAENIKWADLNNLHVTLAFIGDTEKELVKSIGNMLKYELKDFGVIEFNLKGFGLFRNSSNPRIIYSAIENPEMLTKAHEIIKGGLLKLGVTLEEREFNPHLTIGRIKDLVDKNNLLKQVSSYSGKYLQKVNVPEIVYFESVLLPTGPIYKPIMTTFTLPSP
jgi:RNA 2',3'-cyclic 3'-phosphodiesterase